MFGLGISMLQTWKDVRGLFPPKFLLMSYPLRKGAVYGEYRCHWNKKMMMMMGVCDL